MKNTILTLGLILATAIGAFAQENGAYEKRAKMTGLDYGSTNSFVVDGTYGTTLALQASFTGTAVRTTTTLLGITNNDAATNGSQLTLTLAGTNYVYTWTNNPVTSLTTYSAPYTNIVLGITNVAALTNGQTLSITVNAQKNVFTWTNAPVARTDIATNSNLGQSITNLWLTLANNYATVNLAASNITVTVNPLDVVSVAFNEGLTQTNWGTNSLVGIYSITKSIGTNAMQLLQTNAVGWSVTNLLVKLSTDFAGALLVTQPAANQVQLLTVLNPGLSISSSGLWATNLMTTNAINGYINFKGSNSLDQVTWFRDTTNDFSVAYSSTSKVSALMSFTSLGSVGYWAWSVENSSTNYAIPQPFSVISTVKKGF